MECVRREKENVMEEKGRDEVRIGRVMEKRKIFWKDERERKGVMAGGRRKRSMEERKRKGIGRYREKW